MEPRTYSDVAVEHCPACEGHCLTSAALDALLAIGAGASHGDAPVFTEVSDRMDMEAATCPTCGVEMSPYLGPANLRLDRCPGCACVFLDQGELATVLEPTAAT
jgi:Zn-finger nucleic acid-binding protein